MVNRPMLIKNVNAPRRFTPYHTNKFFVDDHLKDPTDVSPFLEVGCQVVTAFIIDSMHTAIDGAF